MRSSAAGAGTVVATGAVVLAVASGMDGGRDPREARSPEHDPSRETAATTATTHPVATAAGRNERRGSEEDTGGEGTRSVCAVGFVT
jgi:hypothetical protein